MLRNPSKSPSSKPTNEQFSFVKRETRPKCLNYRWKDLSRFSAFAFVTIISRVSLNTVDVDEIFMNSFEK